ncbi:MAG TPA: sigma-70 family RNA polymerase sigma factor [Polyangiaceae bacterium]|nr:sigma-70 family RNA polymerase sigma factor [Polyangiaceae bacterium]
MTTHSDTSFQNYVRTVQRYPQHTREEELELVKHFREHESEAARDALVRAHLRHVVAIALKYRRYGLPVADLVAEGNFGIVHALSKYDPERGTRFVTYAAYWIRAYILNYIIRSWSLVGVGSGALRSKTFFKLRRERVRITNMVGEGPEADELLAKSMNLPVEKVTAMVRRLESRDLSLDAQVWDDSATTVLDTLIAPGNDQEQQLGQRELGINVAAIVRDSLKHLDKRERYIVEKRLMADREDELSLAEIGRRLGVSRERARQLEARARRKLKGRISQITEASGLVVDLDAA